MYRGKIVNIGVGTTSSLTWMAEVYWSSLLPILETMGLWDTLDMVLCRRTTWDICTVHKIRPNEV